MTVTLEKKEFIESLIGIIRESKDKESVISLLEMLITPGDELTLKDAYDEAYGSALMQIYEQMEE